MEVVDVTLDNLQFITVRLESGSHIRFQADMEHSAMWCHWGYMKATKDTSLAHMTPAHTKITAYGGTTLPVVGTVLLRVWRGGFSCQLDCKLVEVTTYNRCWGGKPE